MEENKMTVKKLKVYGTHRLYSLGFVIQNTTEGSVYSYTEWTSKDAKPLVTVNASDGEARFFPENGRIEHILLRMTYAHVFEDISETSLVDLGFKNTSGRTGGSETWRRHIPVEEPQQAYDEIKIDIYGKTYSTLSFENGLISPLIVDRKLESAIHFRLYNEMGRSGLERKFIITEEEVKETEEE